MISVFLYHFYFKKKQWCFEKADDFWALGRH